MKENLLWVHKHQSVDIHVIAKRIDGGLFECKLCRNDVVFMYETSVISHAFSMHPETLTMESSVHPMSQQSSVHPETEVMYNPPCIQKQK